MRNATLSLGFVPIFTLALVQPSPVAAQPSSPTEVLFTIALVKKAEKAFVKKLGLPNLRGCVSVDRDDFSPLKWEENSDEDKAYIRLFYACRDPSPKTYGAFGGAILEASKVEERLGSVPSRRLVVRMLAETYELVSGGCSWQRCQDGNPHRTNDRRTCIAC